MNSSGGTQTDRHHTNTTQHNTTQHDTTQHTTPHNTHTHTHALLRAATAYQLLRQSPRTWLGHLSVWVAQCGFKAHVATRHVLCTCPTVSVQAQLRSFIFRHVRCARSVRRTLVLCAKLHSQTCRAKMQRLTGSPPQDAHGCAGTSIVVFATCLADPLWGVVLGIRVLGSARCKNPETMHSAEVQVSWHRNKPKSCSTRSWDNSPPPMGMIYRKPAASSHADSQRSRHSKIERQSPKLN